MLLLHSGGPCGEAEAVISGYGSAQAGAGARVVDSGDIKATTSTKYLVRFGVKYDGSNGTNAAGAEVELGG